MEQNGAGLIRNKIGKKEPKYGLFGVLLGMKIPPFCPSLDQKEQNCFGHPQSYSSIVPISIVEGEEDFVAMYINNTLI